MNYCNHPSLPSSSPSPLQPFASSGQHSKSNAAYFSWPTLSRLNDPVEDRANYFGNLQKGVLLETLGRLPTGQQATSMLKLMTIRAFHIKVFYRFNLGITIGFHIRRGILTDIPAILVFVARKGHRQWLSHVQCLPAALELKGLSTTWRAGARRCLVICRCCGILILWCTCTNSKGRTIHLVDGLRGSDPCIGSGSQTLFPDLWLTEVTIDSYKVPKLAENSKR